MWTTVIGENVVILLGPLLHPDVRDRMNIRTDTVLSWVKVLG